MMRNATELSYRRAAVQQASPAGLVVIMYDLLVEDLQRAIAAMRRSEIEERSKRLKHALLVLQILEGNLDMANGGAAANNLSAFYSHMRGQLLDAQFRSDPAPLQRQIALLLDLREAWQTVDAHPAAGIPSSSPPIASSAVPDSEAPSNHAASWSA